MIPGSNDTLLLNGPPNLGAAAASAYAFMLLAIASVRCIRPARQKAAGALEAPYSDSIRNKTATLS